MEMGMASKPHTITFDQARRRLLPRPVADDAETDVVEGVGAAAVGDAERAAPGGAELVGVHVPGAAAEGAKGAGGSADRVGSRGVIVESFVVAVPAPLGNVAVHV